MSNDYYEKINLNIGWECPKCGTVMAPYVQTCINCNKHSFRSNTASSGVYNDVSKIESLLDKDRGYR